MICFGFHQKIYAELRYIREYLGWNISYNANISRNVLYPKFRTNNIQLLNVKSTFTAIYCFTGEQYLMDWHYVLHILLMVIQPLIHIKRV